MGNGKRTPTITGADGEVREITKDEIKELEPRTADGRYNVRGADGKPVKRYSPGYFDALGVEPPAWAGEEENFNAAQEDEDVYEEERGTDTPPEIRVKKEVVDEPGRYVPPMGEFERKKAAEQTAAVMLTVFNMAVGVALGEGAEMTPDERQAVEEPLARIMRRMSPATTEMIARWTDPIMLISALGAWSARVYFDMQDAAGDESGPPDDEPDVPVPPTNGRGEKHVPTGSANEIISAIQQDNLGGGGA